MILVVQRLLRRVQAYSKCQAPYLILDEDIVCPCMRVHEVHKRTG